MTPKQERFVAEYRKDLNATQAAIRAGYSPSNAHKIGSQLLDKREVAQAVATKTQADLVEVDVDAKRVLKEISRLAFSDVRSLFDEKGNLKPIHTLNDAEAAAIAGCEVIVKNAQAGDGHTDTVHKIKVWDKPKNLEMLAKHFALLLERVEINGSPQLLESLDTWKRANAGR